MATVIGNNQVKLNNGQTVQAQTGGWYDGQQYWGGTLSAPGVINSQSNQQGAGQAVSSEVNRQSDAAQGKAPGTIDSYLDQLRKTDRNPIQEQEYQKLLASSGSGAPAPIGSGQGIGFTPLPSIDLMGIYNNLYKESGISDYEAQLSSQTQSYNQAVSKINDNPFLSEATRVGRLQKLRTDFDNSTANIRNDIATKKADVEMKLNLQSKQFDINSEIAQQELQKFNMLLETGALEGASGEDIANITRATGLSSSMIQSAVNAQREKNVKTSTISFDDGENQGFAVINDRTGEIISKQVVAQSKPSALEEKAALGGGGGRGKMSKSDYVDLLKQDAQSGLTLSQIYAIYLGKLSADEILNLYNATSRYGPDKGSREYLEKTYGVTPLKKSATNISSGRTP